jgi:hypothetical protein
MEKANEFWADIATFIACPIAIAAGCANGVCNAATGSGSFSDGFNAAGASVIGPARKFGADHGEAITKGLLTGAASALGGRVANKILKYLNI